MNKYEIHVRRGGSLVDLKLGQQMLTKIGQQLFLKIDQQLFMKIDQRLFHTIETDGRQAGANQQMF